MNRFGNRNASSPPPIVLEVAGAPVQRLDPLLDGRGWKGVAAKEPRLSIPFWRPCVKSASGMEVCVTLGQLTDGPHNN